MPPRFIAPPVRLALGLAAALAPAARAQIVVVTSPPPGGIVNIGSAAVVGQVIGVPGPAPTAAVVFRTRYPDASICPPIVENGGYYPGALGWSYPVAWDEQTGIGTFTGVAKWLAPGTSTIDYYFPGDLLGSPRLSQNIVYQAVPPAVAQVVVAAHATQRSVDTLTAAGAAGAIGFSVDLINTTLATTKTVTLEAELALPGGALVLLPLDGPGSSSKSYTIAPGDMQFTSPVDPAGMTFAFPLDQAPFPQPAPEGGYHLALRVREGANVLSEDLDVGYWVADRTGKPFRDVTDEAGLGVVRSQSGPNPMAGNGVCAFDYDGDGDTDLYFCNTGGAATNLAIGTNWSYPGGTSFLMRNDGGVFTDVTAAAGVGGAPAANSYGVCAGDVDADGDLDLFVANKALRMSAYRNDGDGTFTEVGAGSFGGATSVWYMTPALGDFDLDADLDLYVGCYMQTFSTTWKNTGWANRLYRNEFEEGIFDPLVPGWPKLTLLNQNVGAASTGLTLGALWTDYDRDGDPDIAVYNDFGQFAVPNQLWSNDGDGTFTEVGAATGFQVHEFSMGAAWADLDGNGLLDCFSSSIGRDSLLLQTAPGSFVQSADGSGADGAYLLEGPEADGVNLDDSWGVVAWDYDLDQDTDLYVVGSDLYTTGNMPIARIHPDSVYENDGTGHFTQRAAELGLANAGTGRSGLALDYDGDGDRDFLVFCENEGATLMRNDLATPNHWVELRPRATRSAPGGFNTFFTLVTADRTQVYEIGAEDSHGGQADTVWWAGLGANAICQVTAEWPRGGSTTIFHQPADVKQIVWESVVQIDGALDAVVPAGTAPLVELLGRPGALVIAAIGDPTIPFPFVFSTGEAMDLFPILAPPILKLGFLDAGGKLVWNLGTLSGSLAGIPFEIQLVEFSTSTFTPVLKSGVSAFTVQ
jgi:hypothetical protein